MTASPLPRWMRGGLTLALLLLSLYDFYFTQIGLAPFPLLGMGMLLFLAAFFPCYTIAERKHHPHYTLLLALAIVGLFFGSAFYGWMVFGGLQLKGAIGPSLGILLLVCLLLRDRNPAFQEGISTAFGNVLAIHLFFWVVQFLFFVATGNYLDYIQPVTGIETRSLYSTDNIELTRFTGLFAEPAICSTFLYMGLTVRLCARGFRFGRLEVGCVLAIMLSLSVLGVFLLVVLFGATVYYLRRRWPVLLLPLIPLLLVVIATTIDFDAPITDYAIKRLQSPLSDPSGRRRLLTGFQLFAEEPESIQLLGKGLGNYDQSDGLTNSVVYLLEYLGILGTGVLLLLVGAFYWVRRAPPVILFFVSATFVGAPLFTNLFWWLWIGLLLLAPQERGEKSV